MVRIMFKHCLNIAPMDALGNAPDAEIAVEESMASTTASTTASSNIFKSKYC